MEQLELSVTTLLEACRKLKDESKRLAVQVEILTHEKQSFLKDIESFKEKLERLSEWEAANSNNEINRTQVREKVIYLLEKLEEFDLT